jgi:hypothetical protein
MTARKKPEPSVGIFWILDGKLILDVTPIGRAELYGEALGHARGHAEHWTRLQRRGVVSRDFEYDDPARGRVVYFPKRMEFVLYADRCILTRKTLIRRIMIAMHLPTHRTKITTDEHYRCLYCLRE